MHHSRDSYTHTRMVYRPQVADSMMAPALGTFEEGVFEVCIDAKTLGEFSSIK